MESINDPEVNVFPTSSYKSLSPLTKSSTGTGVFYNMSYDIWFWRIIVILLIVMVYIIIVKLCNDVDKDMSKYLHHDTIQHMNYIDSILIKNKIKHWVMFGTLFGAVRLKRFVKSDPDFDFGANIEDCNRIIALNDAIIKDGYYIRKMYTYGVNINSKKEEYMWKILLKITYNQKEVGEIILYEKFSDGLMRRYDKEKNINYWPSLNTFPSWFVDVLAKVTIDGKQYDAPRNSEILLEYWYGTNWKQLTMSNDKLGNPDIDYTVETDGKRHLSFLINYITKTVKNKLIIPTQNKTVYIFPENQIEWIKENDPIISTKPS